LVTDKSNSQFETGKMASLLLAFAVEEEERPFHKLIGERSELKILLTGIGQRNAEKAIGKALAEQSPTLVLTCGFAGGLNPELEIGTVVFSVDEDRPGTVNPSLTRPRRGTGELLPKFGAPSLEASGVGSPAPQIPTEPARLASVLVAGGARQARFHFAERVITTASEKRALRQETGADAVEMESGVIRAICRKHSIPSATVRVISDDANQDLPLDFNHLMDSDQNLSYGKLTVALLRSPGKMGALLKLQKQTQAAAEKLAQVLVKVLANFPR
jgi:nucleoside phosphorylase